MYEGADATDPGMTTPFVGPDRIPSNPLASDVEATRPLPGKADSDPGREADAEDELTRPLPSPPRKESGPTLLAPPKVPAARMIAVPAPQKAEPQVPVALVAPPRSNGRMESAPSIQIAPPSRTPGVPTRATPIPRRKSSGRAQSPTLPPQQISLRDLSSLPPVAGSIPPEPTQRSGIRNLALLAAGVAAVMIFAVALRLRPGTLVITASSSTGEPPAAVKFVIDGVERCQSTPCRVEKLAPGAHLVGVSAAGFAPFAERAIVIEPGEHAAQHVSLTPESPEVAQLSVSVSSPGAAVWVDGTEFGPAPITVRDLRPGQHSVRIIDPSHRSKSYDGMVTLAPGESRQLGPIALEPVEAAPPRQEPTPAFANPSTPVVAQVKGTSTRYTSGAPIGSAHSARKHLRSATPDANDKAASDATMTMQMATLDLTSDPPAPVVLNGRPLGMTPLHLAIPPGPQSIVFVHPDLGRKVATVDLVSGARKAVSVHF